MTTKGFFYSVRLCLLICIIQLCSSCANPKTYFLKANHGIISNPKEIEIPLPKIDDYQYIVIENPHINNIIVKSKNGTIAAGDSYPFYHREIKNRFFIFEFEPAKSPDTVNIQLDKSGENLSYTIRLLNKKEFQEYEQKDNLVIGLIIGFYTLTILLSFVLFSYFQSRKVFYFLLYILLSLGWILNDAGILYAYLWADYPLIHKSSRGFFSSITMILFALYIRENKNQFFSKNVIKLVILIITVLFFKFSNSFLVAKGIFPENLKYASIYVNAILLSLFFGSIFIFIAVELKRHKKDHFEMLAIMVYCLFVVSLALKELGISFLIIENIHQFHALPYFFIQLVFMSIHLFKLEADQKREKELAFIEFKINQEKETEKKILEVQENEKKRIAQNIHDEIGGIFVALKYKVLSLKQKYTSDLEQASFDSLIKLSNEGIKKQYSIIDDLLFEIDDNKRFTDTLTDYSKLIMLNQGIEIDLKFDIHEQSWSPFQKTQLYRILVELITNTIKHSGASTIKIEILEKDSILIKYYDDGKGFDINQIIVGNGIKNIQKRINALGGEAKYSNHEGLTIINLIIPLHHE